MLGVSFKQRRRRLEIDGCEFGLSLCVGLAVFSVFQKNVSYAFPLGGSGMQGL